MSLQLRRTAIAAIAFATAIGLGISPASADPVEPAEPSSSLGSLDLSTGSADLDIVSGSLSSESLALLDGALNAPGGIPLEDLFRLLGELGPGELGALESLLTGILTEDFPGSGSLEGLLPQLPGGVEDPDTEEPDEDAGGDDDSTDETPSDDEAPEEEAQGEDSTDVPGVEEEPVTTDESESDAALGDAAATVAPDAIDEAVQGDDKARKGNSTEKEEFLTPTLVVGCGVGDSPVTLGKTYVQPGPNYGFGPWPVPDNSLFPHIPGGHARYTSVILNDGINLDTAASDLKVIWINLSTFKGGLAPLTNRGPLGLPSLEYSTTPNTGDGNVVAALYGRVHYQLPTAESCLVLPAFGSTTVAGAED